MAAVIAVIVIAAMWIAAVVVVNAVKKTASEARSL